MDLSNPQKAFLRVQANSIEGGTTNIMKNILGERVLGCPASPGSTRTCPGARFPAARRARSGRSDRRLDAQVSRCGAQMPTSKRDVREIPWRGGARCRPRSWSGSRRRRPARRRRRAPRPTTSTLDDRRSRRSTTPVDHDDHDRPARRSRRRPSRSRCRSTRAQAPRAEGPGQPGPEPVRRRAAGAIGAQRGARAEAAGTRCRAGSSGSSSAVRTTQHDLDVAHANLQEAAVEAYIHAGSGRLEIAIAAITEREQRDGSRPHDAPHRLLRRQQNELVNEYVALEKRLEPTSASDLTEQRHQADADLARGASARSSTTSAASRTPASRS